VGHLDICHHRELRKKEQKLLAGIAGVTLSWEV